MLVAWMAAVTLAAGCGPDYITQLPVACAETVPVPIVREYPVDPMTANVTVAGRFPGGWKSLGLIGSTYCVDYLRRRKLVARVYRCRTRVVVQVGRRDRTAPRRVQVDVVGAPG